MNTKSNCIPIDCIYNDLLHKGLCIGVCRDTKSYPKDVVRMCWVSRKPAPNMPCATHTQVQMTPRESVGVGVALIRASIIGESMLKGGFQIPQEENIGEKEENPQNNSKNTS